MSTRVIEMSEDDEVPLLPSGHRVTGHAIFACGTCKGERVFGFGKPARDVYLLLCEGTCKEIADHLVKRKHTWHIFKRLY